MFVRNGVIALDHGAGPALPGQAWTVQADTYRLILPADRPFVYLDDAEGARVAELFVLSAVHPLSGRDDTTAAGEWQVEATPDEVVLTLPATSCAWQAKTYRLRCLPRRLLYEITVEGQGDLAEVDYFGGYYSGHVRWGSGFFRSGQRFSRGFNPEPNRAEAAFFAPAGGAKIDLTGVPLPGRGDWFFTPAPFCFALQAGSRWLALGIEAGEGDHGFTEYAYHGQGAAFHLSLAFEGYTHVAGSYTLPAVGFDFARDELGALAAHTAAARARLAGEPQGRPAEPPRWWREPIFCGWGAQCAMAEIEGGLAPDLARQDRYERFLRELDQHGLRPGTVVIDDKWQAAYGENRVDPAKWPDLAGFIRGQHSAGRHVLLWLKAWDPEGIPAGECVCNAAGLPLAVDPTNPAFRRRFQSAIEQMLGRDGYDADGFKVDFTARVPSGPGCRRYGDAWGLELVKTYLRLLYDAAKQVKPDALVITHTPHPYLAGSLDMIRLNDMNKDSDVLAAMRRRAAIARLACPQALIDTDNWPITDRAAWRAYVRLQPELGVPALYFTTLIDSTCEPLEEDDYALLRSVWAGRGWVGASA